MANELEVVPDVLHEEQPELLDAMQYARRLGVEDLVRAGSCLPAAPTETLKRCSNQRTGKILLKQLRDDPEFAEAICSALVLGMSARLVARRFAISPESVVVLREAMTERGELRPVRLRIQAKVDRLAEDGLDETWQGLMDGKIHPGQGWIPSLATVDKSAQAAAGMVSGTDRTVEEVTVARLMAARELVLAHRAAIDSDSGAAMGQGVALQLPARPVGAPATGPATGLPPDGQALEAAAGGWEGGGVGTGGPGAPGPAPGPGGGGGGGGGPRHRRARRGARWAGFENFGG
jgi:hypothetical protein